MAIDKKIVRELERLLGKDAVLSRPEDLLMYEYDGSVEKARGGCALFPRTTAHRVGIAQVARQPQVPIVGRGSGTGLAGGALARYGGILIVFSRMNKILELDLEN